MHTVPPWFGFNNVQAEVELLMGRPTGTQAAVWMGGLMSEWFGVHGRGGGASLLPVLSTSSWPFVAHHWGFTFVGQLDHLLPAVLAVLFGKGHGGECLYE